MSLIAEQIAHFDRDGAVTIDSPFSESEISDAAAAVDRLFRDSDKNGASASRCVEVALLKLATHPFMEEVARRSLGAEQVYYVGNAVSRRYHLPGEDHLFRMGDHSDLTFTWSEFIQRPRTVPVSLLIWISDVTMERAPMMYRPGSHRQLGEKFEQDPWRRKAYLNAESLNDLGLSFAEPYRCSRKRGKSP